MHQRISGLVFLLITHSLAMAQSQLSAGIWYKIGVTHQDIYRLDYDFLVESGVGIAGTASDKIQLFGNGAGHLPQGNSEPRPEGLLENAIVVADGGDGTFDQGDYIQFYGESPDNISFDPFRERHNYSDNIYTDTLFYFLTWGQNEGLRIQNEPKPGTAANVDSKVYRLDYLDFNTFNLLKSGRDWYGHNFPSPGVRKKLEFEVPTLSDDATHQLHAVVMASSFDHNSFFEISVNENIVGELEVTKRVSGGLAKANFRQGHFEFNKADANGIVACELLFKCENANAYGFIDKLVLSSYTDLIYSNSTYCFNTGRGDTIIEKNIGNAVSGLEIWNVSDSQKPTRVVISNGKFVVDQDETKAFVLFGESDIKEPVSITRVQNQDLTNVSSELLIITHPMFDVQAQRLADHRRSFSGLDVAVVYIQDIYNDYGCGRVDPTAIRDFIRSVWQKGELHSVLMFGDGSYDYKDVIDDNTNLVASYQSRLSLNETMTYCSDDYFTFMEDDEGEWLDVLSNPNSMDLGIGRLPVRNIDEAVSVVDKIIYYDTQSDLGSWRAKILFSADDGDENLHSLDSDSLAKKVEQENTYSIVNKLFIDDFAQPNNFSIAAALEYERRMHAGVLLANYLGHGNQEQLATEELLGIDLIKSWTNLNRLNFMVTATCDFGVFDNPAYRSAGERILFEPEGGAIGLITATRPVFSNSNFRLNWMFMDEVFKRNELGEFDNIGQIFRRAKNRSYKGVANRAFVLLGDPAMKLAIPSNIVSIDSIFSEDVPLDSFLAFTPIKVYGSVSNGLGETMPDFSGTMEFIFYDSPSQKLTLGADSDPFPYFDRNSLLFNGQASVTNGQFQIDILLPESSAGITENARIVMYASNQDTRVEAAGGLNDVKVDYGGFIQDNEPPKIELFVGDTLFRNGDAVSSQSYLIARIKDESGVNLSTSNPETKLIGTLNGETFNLNEYYQSQVDSYKTGWINYPLGRLSDGKYELSVRAADLAGNVSQATVGFKTVRGGDLPINGLKTYPNPVNTEDVRISFNHSKPNDELRITCRVYSLSGETVHTQDVIIPNAQSRVDFDAWPYAERATGKVEAGVYVVDMSVLAFKAGASARKKFRLIVR